jgi:hypothetical protein
MKTKLINKRTKRSLVKKTILIMLAAGVMSSVIGCLQPGIHNGKIPFSWMEKPQSKRTATKNSNGSSQVEKMKKIVSYHAETDKDNDQTKMDQIQVGDVIAFYMSHQEAWTHLKKAKIQKVPYELFRYGHLAIVVEDHSQPNNKLKLLQLAMKQKVNVDSDLDYLKDKNWVVYRPRKINHAKLREFVSIAKIRGSSEKKAYDYSGAFGLKNAAHKPASQDKISKKHTCCTLIVAALHYAEYELHCTRRNGLLDIVTPRQVVESWGNIR